MKKGKISETTFYTIIDAVLTWKEKSWKLWKSWNRPVPSMSLMWPQCASISIIRARTIKATICAHVHTFPCISLLFPVRFSFSIHLFRKTKFLNQTDLADYPPTLTLSYDHIALKLSHIVRFVYDQLVIKITYLSLSMTMKGWCWFHALEITFHRNSLANFQFLPVPNIRSITNNAQL